MELQYKFGGLAAEVAASGSVTGTANGGSGIALSSSAETSYGGNGWQESIKWNITSFTKPYLTFGADFGSYDSNEAVAVALTGVENFGISSSDWVTAYVDIKMGKTFGSARGSASRASSIGSANGASLRRSWQESTALQTVYTPGMVITIAYEYLEYKPNKRTSRFLSTVPESGIERNIMNLEFIATSTGVGTVSVQWHNPWCPDLDRGEMFDNAFIEVRTSDNILEENNTQRFTLWMFADKDYIIYVPVENEIVRRIFLMRSDGIQASCTITLSRLQ